MLEGKNTLFQHGSAYVCSLSHLAAYYALRDRGSELVHRCRLIYQKLLERDVDCSENVQFISPDLLALLVSDPDPVLVELCAVNKRGLLSEGGEDPDHNLRMMDRMLTFGRFRLSKPVAVDQLKFYRITEIEGKPGPNDLWEFKRVPM